MAGVSRSTPLLALLFILISSTQSEYFLYALNPTGHTSDGRGIMDVPGWRWSEPFSDDSGITQITGPLVVDTELGVLTIDTEGDGEIIPTGDQQGRAVLDSFGLPDSYTNLKMVINGSSCSRCTISISVEDTVTSEEFAMESVTLPFAMDVTNSFESLSSIQISVQLHQKGLSTSNPMVSGIALIANESSSARIDHWGFLWGAQPPSWMEGLQPSEGGWRLTEGGHDSNVTLTPPDGTRFASMGCEEVSDSEEEFNFDILHGDVSLNMECPDSIEFTGHDPHDLHLLLNGTEIDDGTLLFGALGFRVATVLPPAGEVELIERPSDGGNGINVLFTPKHELPDIDAWSVELFNSDNGDIISIINQSEVPLSVDIESEGLVGGLSVGVRVGAYFRGELVGCSQSDPHTMVDEIPSPPTNLTVRSVEGNGEALFISWTPSNDLDIHHHSIFAIADGVAERWMNISAPTTSTQLDGLESGLEYTIIVQTHDESGQNSEEVLGSGIPVTSDDIPPTLPSLWLSQVAEGDGTSFLASWGDFTENSSDLAVAELWCNLSNNPTGTVSIYSTNSQRGEELIVTSVSSGSDTVLVQPGSVINCSISAEDITGNRVEGETISIETIDSQSDTTPPSPVLGLTLRDAPSDFGEALIVEWVAGYESDITLYEVHLQQQPFTNLPDIAKWNVSQQAPNSTIILSLDRTTSGEILYPGNGYWVAVVAIDGNGNLLQTGFSTDGPSSPIDNLNDVTPPPQLDWVNLTDKPNDDGSALLLFWTPSSAPDISHYDIFIEKNAHPNLQGNSTYREDNPRAAVKTIYYSGPADDLVVVSESNFYFAVVIPVDTAGNTDRLNVTLLGPYTPTNDTITNGGVDNGTPQKTEQFSVNLLGYDLSVLDLVGVVLSVLVIVTTITIAKRKKGLFNQFRKRMNILSTYDEWTQRRIKELQRLREELEVASAENRLTEGQFRMIDRRLEALTLEVDSIFDEQVGATPEYPWNQNEGEHQPEKHLYPGGGMNDPTEYMPNLQQQHSQSNQYGTPIEPQARFGGKALEGWQAGQFDEVDGMIRQHRRVDKGAYPEQYEDEQW